MVAGRPQSPGPFSDDMMRYGFLASLVVVCACAAPCESASLEFRTATLALTLRPDSQTVENLAPLGERDFDFVPAAKGRHDDGFAQLGDLTLRFRGAGSEWRTVTSFEKRGPVRALTPRDGELAAADLSTTFGTDLPVAIERHWRRDGRSLAMAFTLTNNSSAPVEIGALGLPMIFDNIVTDRSLDEAHRRASFVDANIGGDGGYLQVTRLNGAGPALLALPLRGTPLEAWRPLLEDKTKRSHTFEGFFEWMVASRAYAEREWKNAGEPWNPPTSITLAPGERREFGVRFVTSPSIRAIENTLIAESRPVVVGIPGYVVPTDLDASLFVSSAQKVVDTNVSPAGALTLVAAADTGGWQRFSVHGQTHGRARVTLTYADGSKQSIAYFVTKPAVEVARDLGAFISSRQFFDDPNDPFHRAPAILSYDREAGMMLTQEPRVWIAGMSDEAGAGSFVAAMIKQLENPDAAEIARLERVVTETVAGKLQVPDGPHAGGVKKSLFWYDPKSFPNDYDPGADWTTWTSWKKSGADDLGRSFNYPHVAAAYWVMYRLARYHTGLVRTHDWRWYLERAARTALAMPREAPHYSQFGQMEGEVFIDILRDLRREGRDADARALESVMRKRVDHWLTLTYPFGSEMPWDSTGQPEVYAWLRFFGHDDRAATTREVILGYDPAMPGWASNGNARRYWDFLYAGKQPRIERMIHHYGSALNAVPLFDAYRSNPQDFHLLRVAYGGLMGALTNVDPDGFGSVAFHSWPDAMRFDAYTGDYGMDFFGHATSTASYVVKHPVFGWLAFGANVRHDGDSVHIEPRDSARTRLFIAPANLWITLVAGRIASADYSARGGVTIRLAPADEHTRQSWIDVQAGNASPRRIQVDLAAQETAVQIPEIQ